ncbi:MAG: glycosyltransferase WbuB [Acidobacteria bacterium]|nr:MAG: glycosyltransferase WbuB [Acidobacteriota bacterium]
MKIVVHTQYFPPEIGAAPNRLSALVQGLTSAGHEVTVLTAMPNYPMGRYHPGYGGLVRRENHNGSAVIRTFIYPTQSAGMAKRLLCYFSFVFSSVVLGGLLLDEPDYILTESPPLFLGISGFLLSRWKRARWIFNVSDLWPESVVRLGALKPGLALRLSEWLEAFYYRHAWLVSGQSSEIVQNIKKRFPSVPTFYLPNGVDTQNFRPDCGTPEARALLRSKPGCLVLYAGLHGLAQGLEQIIEAADQLRDDSSISFVLVGDGPVKRALVTEAEARGLTNIKFLDPVPQDQMSALVAAADIVLVPLKMHIPGAVPSKLYEAMSSGRALVAIASGEAADIVSRNKVGVVVAPGDTQGLTRSLLDLARNSSYREQLGVQARRAAIAQFDRSVTIARFVRCLEEQLRVVSPSKLGLQTQNDSGPSLVTNQYDQSQGSESRSA